MVRRAPIAVLILAACGPSVGSGDGSADGGHGEDTGADVEASGSAEEVGGASLATDTQGSATADTSAGESGEPADACLLADPDACPDACYRGTALAVIDDACTTNSVDVCLPGGPKPGVPLTTYWAQGSSGPVFAEYGGPCSVAAQPEGWRECMGAPDEPDECACFCQNGYCRGDEDRRVLEACGFASPCGQLVVDPQFGAADHAAEHCVLEALGVRTPGVYEIATSSSFSSEMTRFYLLGDDEVVRLQYAGSDVLTCPQVSSWGRAQRCTLASGAYFGGCVEPQPPGQDCVLDLGAWVTDCSAQPPSCG